MGPSLPPSPCAAGGWSARLGQAQEEIAELAERLLSALWPRSYRLGSAFMVKQLRAKASLQAESKSGSVDASRSRPRRQCYEHATEDCILVLSRIPARPDRVRADVSSST